MEFKRENFYYSGGYLTYDNKFVARFKYSASDKASFTTFLIKNFTVEEYFNKLENESPLIILKSKGYISNSIKRMLKANGYPVTLEGEKQHMKDQIAEWEKVS